MALATRPKRTVQHKKRIGKHRRHNKPYLKAYWPYLPMLLIVGAGLMINSLWSNQSVLGVNSDFSSTTLLAKTNANRESEHDPDLTIDPQLSAAAQAKANDMIRGNYWAHNSPDGKTPWSFIAAAGYQYQSAGENLAYGFANASDAVIGWMNSPEHRANIMNPAYQNVGFGVASSSNYQGKGPQTVVVAEYGQPVPAVANITFTVPEPTATTAPEVKPASTELAAKPVARIQLLTGGKATWSLAAVSALAGAALAIFIIRHGLRFRRLLVKGEVFIAHHLLLDIAIVFIFTAGFVLTRASGITR
jgi:Cysteine-rich secretory protein family